MKHIKLLVGVTALLFIVLQMAAVSAQNNHQENINEFREREEIHQTLRIAPGSRVEVSSIRGSVEIETANIEVAEIHIIRSAQSREDFKEYKISIENTPQSLIVRGETRRSSSGAEYGADVRHQVKLRLPRRVNLSINNVAGAVQVGDVGGNLSVGSVGGSLITGAVNGRLQVGVVSGAVAVGQVGGQIEIKSVSGNVKIVRAVNSLDVSVVSGAVQIGDVSGRFVVNNIGGSLTAGSIDGQVQISIVTGNVNVGRTKRQVEIKSVSGDVKIAQVSDSLDLSVITGAVFARIESLGESGAEINSVSGRVELELKKELSAQLIVNNVSGKISFEVPNGSVQSRANSYAMRALIGKGGPPISINIVTSDVRLISGK